jgi:hypothetical protein
MTAFFSCKGPLRCYKSETKQMVATSKDSNHIISEQDISGLPLPVQKYFRNCGFIGTKQTAYACVHWKWSQIKLTPEKPWLSLETRQYNFVSEPSRIAYMKARMLGIFPFEGRDLFAKGHGHMYGKLAKLIPIFNEKDYEISLGSAIIVLAESLFIPSIALQNYIRWESVDSMSAKARFQYGNINVGGTFYFNESGEYIRFETNDRPYLKPNGGYEVKPYTVLISDYKNQDNLRIPCKVRAIWNLDEGDFEYWRGEVERIDFK